MTNDNETAKRLPASETAKRLPASDTIDRFAFYVATLGRGPGRSRPLTQAEAEDAMRQLLDGTPDPMQVGAFLMLLRYRGEDPEEMTGLVRGAQERTRLPGLGVDLDWPSYGAGRTRTAPWFLLSAMALGQSGVRVLMHGTNEFSGGMTVPDALAALGRTPALGAGDAAAELDRQGFAYVPVDALCPAFAALLGLRRLFGLRSPVNTVARLLNPAEAAAGVDGVFHPPYIETHLAVAERMGRGRLLVLKGGGGEAERNPAKPTQVHIWDRLQGRHVETLPALATQSEAMQGEPAGRGPMAGGSADEPDLCRLWHGEQRHAATEARIVATIALGLMALRGGEAQDQAQQQAQSVWEERRPGP